MFPYAGLVQGSDGFLYGTTLHGGTKGYGTVFKISTNGAFTGLHSFTGINDGAAPFAGLVQGSDGFYTARRESGGAHTYGTVFKISFTGTLTPLHSFTGTDDGEYPEGGLVQGSDGYFYGMTESGGTNNNGTVFKISTTGALTTLHSFTGTSIATPFGGLVQGSDGYIYGLRPRDGNYGTVFKISTTGAYTSLYSFGSGYDGDIPKAGWCRAATAICLVQRKLAAPAAAVAPCS